MSYVKKPIQSFVAICVGLMMFSAVQAQEATLYVLKLSDANISSLKSSGKPLRSQIPADNRGKISAIVIGTAENQGQEAVRLDGKVQIDGETAVIEMDDNMVDEMKKQPLRLNVDQNSFAQVYISYRPAPQPVAQAAPQPAAQPVAQAVTQTGQAPEEDDSTDIPQIEPESQDPAKKMFFVNLNNNETMRGEIDGFEAFKIKCSFGEITMPLDQIAGIRFHTDDKDSAVVVLKNGDSLTGVPTVEAVKIKTSWGQADVAPEHMKSITTSANSSFSQGQTDFGTRWQLRTAIPMNVGGQRYFGN